MHHERGQLSHAHPIQSLRNERPIHSCRACVEFASNYLQNSWCARVEELRTLLLDKDMYNSFLHSLEQIRHVDSLRDDLKKGNVDLARHNLAKEAEIAELRKQCMIIRNTQLAAARESFEEVEKREKEISGRYSPASLLDRLQEVANEADEESEKIHREVLQGEIHIGQFVSKYRKQRTLYHKRTLTRLAAMTSLTTPG